MYTVYVLKSINQSFMYVGLTDNLDRRLSEHNCFRSRSTKPYAPFRLIYSELFETRSAARISEKYLKSTDGKYYLNVSSI